MSSAQNRWKDNKNYMCPGLIVNIIHLLVLDQH